MATPTNDDALYDAQLDAYAWLKASAELDPDARQAIATAVGADPEAFINALTSIVLRVLTQTVGDPVAYCEYAIRLLGKMRQERQ